MRENPDDTTVNLEGTVAFLREQDADVVFLQEVEQGYEGGKQQDPPPHYTYLKEALPKMTILYLAIRWKILWRFPSAWAWLFSPKRRCRNFFRVDLPPAEISFEYGGIARNPSNRLLIGAETDIEGNSVRLLNTHLRAFFMIGATSNDHPLNAIWWRRSCAKASATVCWPGGF